MPLQLPAIERGVARGSTPARLGILPGTQSACLMRFREKMLIRVR